MNEFLFWFIRPFAELAGALAFILLVVAIGVAWVVIPDVWKRIVAALKGDE